MEGLLKNQHGKRKRVKRGGRKHNKSEPLVIFSSNAAGLKLKAHSLKNVIQELNVGIFTIQETHFPKKGNFKHQNFEIFEAIRSKEKGGTMVGAHKALNPVLIQDYSEDFELIVIEIKIRDKEIRIMTGYGPQESWNEVDRIPFFVSLEKEISKAELLGKSIIIEMDSNSKLGKEYISKDPHNQSQNGRILAGIIDRHGLIVANGLDNKCIGAITRSRATKEGDEKSIIDHVIISEDLRNDLESLKIDEENEHALNKVVKTNKGVKKTKSDHNPLISTFQLRWNSRIKAKRIEIYNLKNVSCQEKFKKLTENGTYLSEVFENEDINKCTEMFLNRLTKVIKRAFNKIRIKEKPDDEEIELNTKRKQLKHKNDEKSKSELEIIEQKLAEKYSTKNYNIIKEEVANIKVEEGGLNSGHLWRLKKKLSPRCRDPPTAMMDKNGVLHTSAHEIEDIALETYQNRLRNREIKDELKHIKDYKEKLCMMRLEKAKRNKTTPWTKEQLEVVLKRLKKNKSRDPMGMANELFSNAVAGDDLKNAVLKLMNRIKEEQIFPEALELCNISSIYKNKNNKNDFENYRGIFRVPILRTILDRLIYEDEYQNIDNNLTDSNVGARRGRNIRDNIFVLNAINNSVTKGKSPDVDIQVFDIEKCFDALWMQECINDLFDSGFQNDKLSLLFLENQNAQIAIKTPQGVSKRKSIKNIIMQGTVWGSLFCTATMDKLGKKVYENKELLYKYKEKVEIPTLGMVDDILSIQKCSMDSVKANSVINAFVEMKKLTLSKNKCQRIHIKNKQNKNMKCPTLKVHESEMGDSVKQKYLGDIIEKSGKIRATIEDRQKKGFAIVAEILAILEEIPLGKHKMEIGLHLRQAMLLNGILFNSEAWHDISEDEIRKLEKVDEYLLRSLVKAHSKVPLEFLYLEAGATPVRFVISCRRILYLQNILKRPENELIKRVYKAQQQDAVPGDFVQLVKEDLKVIGINNSESYIEQTSTKLFKSEVKKKVQEAAFKYLKNLQSKHSKTCNIQYKEFKTQNYMTTPIFSNNEVNLLHALRSRMVNVKMNFKSKYRDLSCPLCSSHEDDQSNVLTCKVLKGKNISYEAANNKSVYEDIFKETGKQKEVTHLFQILLNIRKEEEEKRTSCGTAPSIPYGMLENSENIQTSIVHYFSGK